MIRHPNFTIAGTIFFIVAMFLMPIQRVISMLTTDEVWIVAIFILVAIVLKGILALAMRDHDRQSQVLATVVCVIFAGLVGWIIGLVLAW